MRPTWILAAICVLSRSGAASINNNFPCKVLPIKPLLGIDLRFHSGFDLDVPFREIQGSGSSLNVRFQVTPKSRRRPAVTFSQQLDVPPIRVRTGDVKLRGIFDLGEGQYHVDWQLRDHDGRVCASSWELEAALSSKESQIEVALPPDAVRRPRDNAFGPDPVINRRADETRAKVKILVDFEPQNPKSMVLHPLDATWLVSIVRSISHNVRIGQLSLTALNIRSQTVFYRQDYSERIDFPALGNAAKAVGFATIQRNRLARKHGETEFLTNVIRDATNDDSHPDALIFIGPKILIEPNISQHDLNAMKGIDYPIFLLNYNRTWQSAPGDSMARMVKFFSGSEYTISSARDLWTAVNEMTGRISGARQARITGGFDAREIDIGPRPVR